MTAVFVGGSRRITRLPMEAKTRIDNVVDRGFAILVGDANGADKAVQKHLAEAKYDKVTVYCSGDTSRNNVGQWETRNVSVAESEKTFQFYAAKDREMAQQAEFGLMIWDGKSSGTVLNILRLVRASKKAVLVSVAEKSEVEFMSKGGLGRLSFAVLVEAASRYGKTGHSGRTVHVETGAGPAEFFRHRRTD